MLSTTRDRNLVLRTELVQERTCDTVASGDSSARCTSEAATPMASHAQMSQGTKMAQVAFPCPLMFFSHRVPTSGSNNPNSGPSNQTEFCSAEPAPAHSFYVRKFVSTRMELGEARALSTICRKIGSMLTPLRVFLLKRSRHCGSLYDAIVVKLSIMDKLLWVWDCGSLRICG